MPKCKKGKQYLSKSFLNPSGTCAPCPLGWEFCYHEPINDQKRCVDSCRGQANPKTKLLGKTSSTAKIRSTTWPTRLPTTFNVPAGVPRHPIPSRIIFYPTKNDPTLPPGKAGLRFTNIVAVVGMSVAFLLVLVVSALALIRRYRRGGRPSRRHIKANNNHELVSIDLPSRPLVRRPDNADDGDLSSNSGEETVVERGEEMLPLTINEEQSFLSTENPEIEKPQQVRPGEAIASRRQVARILVDGTTEKNLSALHLPENEI